MAAEEKLKNENEKTVPVRLPKYFRIVNGTSALSGLLFFLIILLFPDNTSFVTDRRLALLFLFCFFASDTFFYFFGPRLLLKTKVIFVVYLKSILSAIFLAALLYSLGGIQSFFVIILVFPILSTGFDLDAWVILSLGIITEVFLFAIMVLDPHYPHTLDYYLIGLSEMLLIAIFVFYLYKIIGEGIRHRFEKEEARRKYFDLSEVDSAKTEFITVVSHRLLTPLSELRWAFDRVFENKKWNKETENILIISRGSVNTLIDVVRDLIHITDLEKEELVYHKDLTDISDVIVGAVAELRDSITDKEVTMEFKPSPGEFMIKGDPERLKSAFLDIIDNAVKYSPKGTVAISVAKGKNGLKILIADDGIGIPYQEQARIFTKFFRASNAIKLIPTATGVGLFMAKSIIEKHRGTVDFISEPGKGTTFTVFLPAFPEGAKEIGESKTSSS